MNDDLVDLYEAFQRGGHGLTIAEWKAMSSEEQAAAIEASNRIATERAALVAYYVLYPMETLKMVVGEEAAVKAALTSK